MIYAVVENGHVINLVEWDGSSDWQPVTGFAVRVPDGVVVGIGDAFENGTFTAASVPHQDSSPAS